MAGVRKETPMDTIQLRFPPDLHKAVADVSDAAGMSRNEYVRAVLRKSTRKHMQKIEARDKRFGKGWRKLDI